MSVLEESADSGFGAAQKLDDTVLDSCWGDVVTAVSDDEIDTTLEDIVGGSAGHCERWIFSAALSPAGDVGETRVAFLGIEKALAVDLLLDCVAATAGWELRSVGEPI